MSYPTDELHHTAAFYPSGKESQIFRLQTISEIRDFLELEIKERKKLADKPKFYANFLKIGDLIFIVIDAGACAALSLTGIGVVPSLALAGVLPVVQIPVSLMLKKLEAKVKKHNDIGLLASAKLDTVNEKVSKALIDGCVSDTEFSNILNEKRLYIQRKKELQQNTKKLVIKLTDQERSKLIEKGRQEERDNLSKNLLALQKSV
jgi:hypothetical protein